MAGAKQLVPSLTSENHVELLDLARHESRRAIERILADRTLKPDVPARIRQLPDREPVPAVRIAPETAWPTREAPSRGATPFSREPRIPTPPPSPLGSKRFKFQFTGDQALYDKLCEAKALLRHRIPDGDMAEIFDRALTLLVEDAKRTKFGKTSRPRTRSKASRKPGAASRHIPAEIKRAVVARDGGRCAFVAATGRRCGSRNFLEFHHRDAWARAKRHSTDRIELRSRGHNRYAAVQDFGAGYMARFTRRDDWSRDQLDVKQRE